MDLWIRSQDKESLRKINTGFYLKRDLSEYAKGEVIFIVSGGDKLGEYETKERALEVLDEIQEFIENKDKIKITQDINGITSQVEDAKRVYIMPEE